MSLSYDPPAYPAQHWAGGRMARISASDAVFATVGSVLLAAIVCGLPVALHLISQVVAIGVCVVLTLIAVTVAPTTVPAVLIFPYLFQNLFVAFVSPTMESPDELNSIRAYNFLITAVAWIVLAGQYWLAHHEFSRPFRILMNVTTAVMALIGLYFILGMTVNPAVAVAYLRNIVTPFLLIQAFAIVAYRHRVSIGPLILIAVLALFYGYLEMVWHDRLLQLVNGDTYIELRIRQDYEAGVWLRDLKETGRVMRSYLDTLTIDLLNTPLLGDLNIQLYRLVGPNFHSISWAYFLAAAAACLLVGVRWWYFALALPLVFAIGSKGALVFMLFVAAAMLAVRLGGMLRSLWVYVAALCAYAAVGIKVGIAAQDYHVIGFIGGLRGFVSNPFGHGIGAGGNLSVSVSTLDWSRSQQLGHTDVAVESAVGVLLYQMGIAAVLVAAAIGWIAWLLWSLYRATENRAYAATALSILVVAFNGIFQEEALFAPLAFGTVMASAGMLLGQAYRPEPNPNVGSTATYTKI